jgi:hypothetical protein
MGPRGQGTTRIASLFRFGNETRSPLCGPLKCSAKASGSGWLTNPGLSSRTNSNGRPTEVAVIGGVSQRNAENGASASRAMKKVRKTASSCHQCKTSEYLAGRFSKSTLTTRPRTNSSILVDHIPSPGRTNVVYCCCRVNSTNLTSLISLIESGSKHNASRPPLTTFVC